MCMELMLTNLILTPGEGIYTVYSVIIIAWELGNKTTLGERVPSQVFSERHGDMVPHQGGGRGCSR